MLLKLFAILLGTAVGSPSVPVKHVVKHSEAPAHLIAGGKATARLYLNATTGSSEAALTHLTLNPGAAVPPHKHPESAEIIYIQQGTMEMVIAGKTMTASAGDAVYIPANTEHSARVVGAKESVIAVQIYAGPGPEQRFTKGKKVPPVASP